ncbi:MAG TPA: hypothetical protein VIE67_13395 [Rudaea sp.]|jgi:hypothetical protein|uniref:hypothetical protein n=1 Tax=Rudaea sp. TaxID=2136325 RepID=UPI002F94B3D9
MSDEKNIAQQKFDREFEEFLRDDDSRLAALYRKLPQPEPDAQLDARVRALAQRAAREPATAATQIAARRRSNRLPALGAAAAFLLAAGIAWRVAPQMWPARNQVAAPATETTSVAAPAANRATASPSTATGKPDASATDSAAANAPAAAVEAFGAKASARPVPPRPTEAAPSTGGALAHRELPPPASAAPAKTAETPAQAFPAAPALAKESARDKLGKVENAASAPAAAPLAEPAPVAKSMRIDENKQKQRVDDQFAAQQGVLQENAAKSAPAAALQGAPAAVTQLNCPVPLRGKDWQGTYPPDIPPSDELRFAFVQRLLQQGHRELAFKAYADFHEHCPRDPWRQDLLDQLGLK